MTFTDLSPKNGDCPFLIRKKLEEAVKVIAALTVENRNLKEDSEAKRNGIIKLFNLTPAACGGPTAE